MVRGKKKKKKKKRSGLPRVALYKNIVKMNEKNMLITMDLFM